MVLCRFGGGGSTAPPKLVSRAGLALFSSPSSSTASSPSITRVFRTLNSKTPTTCARRAWLSTWTATATPCSRPKQPPGSLRITFTTTTSPLVSAGAWQPPRARASTRNYTSDNKNDDDGENSHRRQFERMQQRLGDEQAWENSQRRTSRTQQLVYAIVAVEVGIFGVWAFWSQQDPGRQQWMQDNFTMSLRNLDAGRWWTVATSSLSHFNVLHLVLNVSFTLTLGGILARLGVRPLMHFGTLAASAALGSSAAFVAHHKLNPEGGVAGGLGASGINSGFLAATALMIPNAQLLLFGIVPLRIWQIALITAAVDAYFLNSDSRIGHSAHLGGAVTAVAWWLVFRRSLPRVAG